MTSRVTLEGFSRLLHDALHFAISANDPCNEPTDINSFIILSNYCETTITQSVTQKMSHCTYIFLILIEKNTWTT